MRRQYLGNRIALFPAFCAVVLEQRTFWRWHTEQISELRRPQVAGPAVPFNVPTLCEHEMPPTLCAGR